MWFSRFFLTLLQLLHFALLFSYGQWFASVCFVARSQSKYSSCCSMLVCSFIKYLVYILIILCFPSRIICVGLGMFASHKFSMREVVSFLFLYMWTDGSINTHYTCSWYYLLWVHYVFQHISPGIFSLFPDLSAMLVSLWVDAGSVILCLHIFSVCYLSWHMVKRCMPSFPAGKTGIVDYTNYDDMKYAVKLLFSFLWIFMFLETKISEIATIHLFFCLVELEHPFGLSKLFNDFLFFPCRSRSSMVLSFVMLSHGPEYMYDLTVKCICVFFLNRPLYCNFFTFF